MASRTLQLLAIGLLTIGAVGCRNIPLSPSGWFQPPPPVAFPTPPTVDDIVRVVNSNSAPVQQLSSDSAYLTVAGFPPLRANLDVERPKRFRLRASLIGPEVDVGSNDELFWVWIKQSPEPGILYARHDAFARSPLRQQLPIDPSMLTEALGLVQLDPLAQYEGPVAGPTGELEIRTRITTPQGELTRAYVIHPSYGWVLQQHVYDPRGQLLASARASRHRYDPNTGVALPQHVELSAPSADLVLTLSVAGYRINQPVGNPDLLWSLPQMEGYPLLDITDPRTFGSAPPSVGNGTTIPASAPSRPGPPTVNGAPSGVASPTPSNSFGSAPVGVGATPVYTPQPPPGANAPRYRGYSTPWR